MRNIARVAMLLLLVIGIALPLEMADVSSMPASLGVSCPEGMTRIAGTDLCTHGDDPEPPGHDEDEPAPLLPEPRAARLATQLECTDDGKSGARVQVLYVHTGVSRYADVLPSLRAWTAGIDTIVNASAAKTGGVRHVRFVHDASCIPTIPEVRVSSTSFGGMINDLKVQGFNRSDRQYVIWADATVYCGIGTVSGTDRGPGYARIDSGCWSSMVATHELFHTLGAVSLQAPNTSGGWHCIDEYDVMCYRDSSSSPEMRYDCPDRSHDQLLDCGNQDYFSTNPPAGSWLAAHWNTANSRFLSGSTAPPPITSAPPTSTQPPTVTPHPKKRNCRQNNKKARKKCKRKGKHAATSATDQQLFTQSTQWFVGPA